MNKTFEEIALDIVKIYIDSKIRENTGWQLHNDYEVSGPDQISYKVQTIADALAENYRTRAVRWDNANFDREVEKMLTKET